MEQNIISLGWDYPQFSKETQVIIKDLETVRDLGRKIGETAIKPGSTGGWTELKAKVDEVNKTQAEQTKIIQLQEAAEQSRLKTQKLRLQIEAEQLKSTKAQVQADNEVIKQIALEEAARQKLLKTQQQTVPLQVTDAGSRDAGGSAASPATTAAFEKLRQAEAEEAIAAAEYSRQQNISVTATNNATQAKQKEVIVDAELIKAEQELAKAASQRNVKLQGFKVETEAANKQAKEQALLTSGLLGPYQLLNKQYEAAAINAKNLGVEYGVESVQAKAAAAEALALNTKLQAIDKTVGQSQKNVGNYAGGISKAFGALRSLAYILPGIGIAGLFNLAFEAIGKAVQNLNLFNSKLSDSARQRELLLQIEKESSDNYGKEAGQLQILRAEIESTSVPMAARLQAIKDIKEQYPDYFAGLTNEQILNGNVADAYDRAAAAILRKAFASAASSQIEKNVARDLQIIQEGLHDAEETNLKLRDKSGKSTVDEFGNLINVTKQTNTLLVDAFSTRKKARADERADIKKDNDFLLKYAIEGAKVKIDESKGSKAKSVNAFLQSTKEALDLEFELYKIAQARKLKLFEQESADVKNSFSERVQFAEAYRVASIELAERTAAHDIASREIKLKDLKANLSAERNAQLTNIGLLNADLKKAKTDIDKENIATEIENQKRGYEAKRSGLAIEIANERKQIIIATAKKNDDLLAIEDKFLKEQAALAKAEEQRAEAERQRVFQEAAKSIANVRTQQGGAIDAIRDTEKASHDKLLHDKAISQEKYDKLEKKSVNDVLILSLQADLQKAQSLRALAVLQKQSTVDIDNAITSITAKIQSAKNQASGKKDLSEQDKRNTIVQLAKEATDAIQNLVDIGYQKEIEAIQTIIDLNNQRKDQEIANINASTLSNQEKASQLIILDKAVAANNHKLAVEQNQIRIKQAKFDRDLAILKILEDVAGANFKLIAQGGFAGIAAGIAVGLQATAAIASILAKPLPSVPAYAEGVGIPGRGHHHGGPAIVGEAGRERVEPAGGRSFIADHPMLLNSLPPGSRVIPLTNSDVMTGASGGAAMAMAHRYSQVRDAEAHNREIVQAIQEGSRMTVAAMKKQKGNSTTVIVNGDWNAYVTRTVRS